MSFQLWCMAGMVLACMLSAIDWWMRGEYSTAIAFLLFGLGDFTLAIKTWS